MLYINSLGTMTTRHSLCKKFSILYHFIFDCTILFHKKHLTCLKINNINNVFSALFSLRVFSSFFIQNHSHKYRTNYQ